LNVSASSISRESHRQVLPLLNVGCGDRRIDGAVNLDHRPGPGVDVVADLERLPLRNSSVRVVMASHVLEHASDLSRMLREIHRVLVPGGLLLAWVPHGLHRYMDNPWHTHPWTEETVRALAPDRVSTDLDRLQSGWQLRALWTRKAGWWHVRKWLGLDVGQPLEIHFSLEAVK